MIVTQELAGQSSCIAQLVSSEGVDWKIATDPSDNRQYVAKRTLVGASNGLRDMLKVVLVVNLVE